MERKESLKLPGKKSVLQRLRAQYRHTVASVRFDPMSLLRVVMNESHPRSSVFGLHAGLVHDTRFDAVHQLEGKEWNSRIPNKLGSQAENVYRYKFPTVSDWWVSVCKQSIARSLGSFSDQAKR